MTNQAMGNRVVLLKTCVVCGERKSLDDFHRHSGRRDGRDSTCKACGSLRGKRWYRDKQKATNRLYSTYRAMRHRCHYPKHEHYPIYGGRGIRVCQAWLDDFQVFCDWATQAGYRPGLQLDRIDNEKGYCPENCRFVTPSQNARNKRQRERPIRTNPKLTEEQVKQVRGLLTEGLTQREIGRRFSVTHGTIGAIKRRQTWADVL